jgi:hypothetical protein
MPHQEIKKTCKAETSPVNDESNPDTEKSSTIPEDEQARWEATMREIQALLEDEMCH